MPTVGTAADFELAGKSGVEKSEGNTVLMRLARLIARQAAALRSLRATMSQKSSPPQVAKSLSQVLMSDTARSSRVLAGDSRARNAVSRHCSADGQSC